MTENQMGGVRTAARDEGSEVAQHAKEAAGQVGTTVREQTAQVTRETADQARHVVRNVRERVQEEADQQAQRVSSTLDRIADELSEMAGNAPGESMSAGAIQSAADTGRQAARFLDERGAQGLFDSVRDFARRKPGTFLLGAAVAGFLVGRVAKSATGGDQSQSQGQARPESTAQSQLPPPVTPAYGTRMPDYGSPRTPSAQPPRPAAGVPHVEP